MEVLKYLKAGRVITIDGGLKLILINIDGELFATRKEETLIVKNFIEKIIKVEGGGNIEKILRFNFSNLNTIYVKKREKDTIYQFLSNIERKYKFIIVGYDDVSLFEEYPKVIFGKYCSKEFKQYNHNLKYDDRNELIGLTRYKPCQISKILEYYKGE